MAPWIVILLILIAIVSGLIVLILYLYGFISSTDSTSAQSDTWKNFLQNMRQMQNRGKNIGLVVCGEEKKKDLLERVDQRLLPCVEYALDHFYPSNALRHAEVNSSRDKMPPNCHVLAVFAPEVEGDKFIIKVSYYTTNAAGQRSAEPLRYHSDVLKLTYTEWNQLSKRDALCSSFRRYFPRFIAAVARKLE